MEVKGIESSLDGRGCGRRWDAQSESGRKMSSRSIKSTILCPYLIFLYITPSVYLSIPPSPHSKKHSWKRSHCGNLSLWYKHSTCRESTVQTFQKRFTESRNNDVGLLFKDAVYGFDILNKRSFYPHWVAAFCEKIHQQNINPVASEPGITRNNCLTPMTRWSNRPWAKRYKKISQQEVTHYPFKCRKFIPFPIL